MNNRSHGARRHLGAAQVAEEVGVARSTVTASLRRHGPTSPVPFPEPAVWIGTVPGWKTDQLEDIREWFGRPRQGRPRTAQE